MSSIFREIQCHHFADGFIEPDYAHRSPVNRDLPDLGKGVSGTW
jgi:hypothetical protein